VDISILVFAEVVYRVDGVFLEIRERFEKLCNVYGSQAFEGHMGRMRKFNGMDQRISSLRGGRTRIRIRGPCIRGWGKMGSTYDGICGWPASLSAGKELYGLALLFGYTGRHNNPSSRRRRRRRSQQQSEFPRTRHRHTPAR
jgi:hypothetical protein